MGLVGREDFSLEVEKAGTAAKCQEFSMFACDILQNKLELQILSRMWVSGGQSLQTAVRAAKRS